MDGNPRYPIISTLNHVYFKNVFATDPFSFQFSLFAGNVFLLDLFSLSGKVTCTHNGHQKMIFQRFINQKNRFLTQEKKHLFPVWTEINQSGTIISIRDAPNGEEVKLYLQDKPTLGKLNPSELSRRKPFLEEQQLTSLVSGLLLCIFHPAIGAPVFASVHEKSLDQDGDICVDSLVDKRDQDYEMLEAYEVLLLTYPANILYVFHDPDSLIEQQLFF